MVGTSRNPRKIRSSSSFRGQSRWRRAGIVAAAVEAGQDEEEQVEQKQLWIRSRQSRANIVKAALEVGQGGKEQVEQQQLKASQGREKQLEQQQYWRPVMVEKEQGRGIGGRLWWKIAGKVAAVFETGQRGKDQVRIVAVLEAGQG